MIHTIKEIVEKFLVNYHFNEATKEVAEDVKKRLDDAISLITSERRIIKTNQKDDEIEIHLFILNTEYYFVISPKEVKNIVS